MADKRTSGRTGLFWRIPVDGLALAVLALSLFLFFSARWYLRRYGDVGFESVLYAIRFHASVAEKGQIRSFVHRAVLPALAVFLAVLVPLFAAPRGRRLRIGPVRVWPFSPWGRLFVAVLVSAPLVVSAARRFGAADWLRSRAEASTLYEKEYVDPASVRISFPERRRNLVCLYIESCETTFFSTAQGGALPESAMPELFALAQEGVSFSRGEGLGGWDHAEGTGWTSGAMVALTAGVPLTLPVRINSYGDYERFLPGVRALGDLLRDAGYRQALVIGSDKTFGGRDKYYLQHGTDEVLDYGTALRDGVVSPGYKVWLVIDDRHLYPWAEREIRRLADGDRPFAVTILTADTHAPDGYVCPLCPTNYPSQYANVFACASRQAGEFVDWLRRQDFWENTTVLVCGDHLCHAPDLFSGSLGGVPRVRRFVYNCILNSVREASPDRAKNRVFTPMDLYPTLVSALGCTIEGDRLGLGTDLFSDRATLAERMGLRALNAEIRRMSDFYFHRLVLGEASPAGEAR